MTGIQTKVIIALLGITGAAVYLVQAGVRTGWVYSMDADAFLQQTELHSRRVRLTGNVGETNVQASPAMLLAKFDLVSNGQSVRVEYHGTVPDMFMPGHEVVVEGSLDGDGVFQADVLLTKCASKYNDESSTQSQLPPGHQAISEESDQ